MDCPYELNIFLEKCDNVNFTIGWDDGLYPATVEVVRFDHKHHKEGFTLELLLLYGDGALSGHRLILARKLHITHQVIHRALVRKEEKNMYFTYPFQIL